MIISWRAGGGMRVGMVFRGAWGRCWMCLWRCPEEYFQMVLILLTNFWQEMSSIDNVMKSKLNTYNLAKGSLLQMQRKRTWALHLVSLVSFNAYHCRGNLSVRSLADIVTKDHIVQDSEYIDSIILAVPKRACFKPEYFHYANVKCYRSSVKEFSAKYERLTPMVVPRSAVYATALLQ